MNDTVADALSDVFSQLRIAGYRAPDAWAKQDPMHILSVWLTALPSDITAAEIREAGLRWMRRQSDGYVQAFPTPAQLVAMVRVPFTDGDWGAMGGATWNLVLKLQRSHRERGGWSNRTTWKSDWHRDDAEAQLGAVAMATLEAIGGYDRIEQAQLGPPSDVSTLSGVFIGWFRTFAQRAEKTNGASLASRTPTVAMQAPVAQIAEDMGEMNPGVADVVRRALRGETVDREALRKQVQDADAARRRRD